MVLGDFAHIKRNELRILLTFVSTQWHQRSWMGTCRKIVGGPIDAGTCHTCSCGASDWGGRGGGGGGEYNNDMGPRT